MIYARVIIRRRLLKHKDVNPAAARALAFILIAPNGVNSVVVLRSLACCYPFLNSSLTVAAHFAEYKISDM
jgi:hypothetical protein